MENTFIKLLKVKLSDGPDFDQGIPEAVNRCLQKQAIAGLFGYEGEESCWNLHAQGDVCNEAKNAAVVTHDHRIKKHLERAQDPYLVVCTKALATTHVHTFIGIHGCSPKDHAKSWFQVVSDNIALGDVLNLHHDNVIDD